MSKPGVGDTQGRQLNREEGLVANREIDQEQVPQARKTVARHARDAGECADLLGMLGLLPAQLQDQPDDASLPFQPPPDPVVS